MHHSKDQTIKIVFHTIVWNCVSAAYSFIKNESTVHVFQEYSE